MIWSEQELANMPIGGKNVAVERFMKHLDEPVNASIFKPENFSFLWGILGVAGLQGASEEAREEIWEALKQNGAIDAYDKGILGDFNRRMTKIYPDNRLAAWRKLDNYDAGLKFRNVILRELLKTNEKLEKEAAPYCIDVLKLVSGLAKFPMKPQLKAFLEQIRAQVPDAYDEKAMAAAYEKETILRKLTDVLVYAQRAFSEDEKEYLYFYLKEAITGGFDAKTIGVDDRVLARLCTDKNLDEMADLDAYPLRARNADILSLAQSLEKNDDFFEQTAAKYILNDKEKIPALVERCLAFINDSKMPRGVFFALELSNLQQTRSAFTVLVELAKKGRATEAACFVHRLLPQAKGTEYLLVDTLITNLKQIRNNPYLGDNAPFGEYVAQIYIQAARSFSEAWLFKEGALLLKELAAGMWLDGVRELYPSFISLANHMLAEDKETTNDLVEAARMLHLRVYENWNNLFIDEEEDNPLTATRQRIQEKVMNMTTFDIGHVLDRMSKTESSTYSIYQNVKNTLKNKNKAKEGALKEDSKKAQFVFCDDVKTNSNNELNNKVNTLDKEKTPFQNVEEIKKDEQPISEFKEPQVPAIVEWPASESLPVETQPSEPIEQNSVTASGRAKINISNILNIKAEDVDKHFEKIKQVTTTAIHRAEEQALRLKLKRRHRKEGESENDKLIKEGVKKILKIFNEKRHKKNRAQGGSK